MPRILEHPPSPEPLWTPTETAEFLRIPRQTLYKWRVTGDGPPGYRVGRHLRYLPAEVKAWVRARGTA